MKKGFAIGLATGLTVAGASLVLANSQIQAILNEQIKVTLNGQVQEFKDETTNETQYPITYHDRTYLPLRTVANIVGVDVDYDANNNTAILNSNNTNFKYNIAKRKEVQAVMEGYVEVLVDLEGNVYLHTVGNYENATDSNIRDNLNKIEKKFNIYSPKGYVGYAPVPDSELKAYKLNVSNVLTSYFVRMGQAGYGYFIFVKENGTLSYLSYDKLINNGEIDLKDINALKNVVSVVKNDYTLTPYAIDAEGNEISLYDYLK